MNNKALIIKDKLKSFKMPFKVPDKKTMFWAWVTYQAIKGSLTTAFIWIPAILYWLNK